MSKKDKYKIPKDYFDKLDERVWDAVNNPKEEIKDEAPTLYKLADKTGYRIPKHYFSAFEVVLPKKSKVIAMGKTLVGLAASFALMIICYGILNNEPQNADLLIADLDDADIYEYLFEDPDNLDEELLADYLLTNNQDEIEIEEFIDAISIDDIIELEDL